MKELISEPLGVNSKTGKPRLFLTCQAQAVGRDLDWTLVERDGNVVARLAILPHDCLFEKNSRSWADLRMSLQFKRTGKVPYLSGGDHLQSQSPQRRVPHIIRLAA
jgi:hypothetical protein